jgi:hypothetical protein
VARWRGRYSQLHAEAKDSILVIIGPFLSGQTISDDETGALQGWISTGGRALIISRVPIEQFGDPSIRAKAPDKSPARDATPEQFIYEDSDQLIAQPTELTRKVRGLALSNLASRLLSDAEMTLAGESIDDARLLTMVSRMRRIISQTAPRV